MIATGGKLRCISHDGHDGEGVAQRLVMIAIEKKWFDVLGDGTTEKKKLALRDGHNRR